MNKKLFYTEMAYAIGLVLLALGTALMEKADFGMSMVVAPAYLVYRKISQSVSWFSFGMAEYCLQAALLIVLTVVMKKFKISYLFSFCTAVLYGLILDFWIRAVGSFPDGTGWAGILYIAGVLLCALGVAMLFRTYIPPEAYELLVKEISKTFHKNITVVKTIYDCISCGAAVVLSFVFFGFGHFEGIKVGTVLCALLNGWLIGKFGAWLEAHFDFQDGLPFRKKFC